jgi:hypothetical protein
MSKQATKHTSQKLDSRKLAKKLQDLQEKLSKKTVYAVKKHYDAFAVAETHTNKSVIKDLPTYELADYLAFKLNRNLITPERANVHIIPLLSEYYRHQLEIFHYKNIINNTSSQERRLVMYDRIQESTIAMDQAMEKIRYNC